MDETKLIAAFEEATQHHANEGVERGLHPIHVANVLMLAAIQITVQIEGVERTRAGLLRAAENLGAG